jgi:hypothetical protein
MGFSWRTRVGLAGVNPRLRPKFQPRLRQKFQEKIPGQNSGPKFRAKVLGQSSRPKFRAKVLGQSSEPKFQAALPVRVEQAGKECARLIGKRLQQQRQAAELSLR